MINYGPADQLHRLVKQSLDNGTASSLEEAKKQFKQYKLILKIGATEVTIPSQQAALLTAVALGRRVFLGGVSVEGNLDVPLKVPLPLGTTLRDAINLLGAYVNQPFDQAPVIFIGGGPIDHQTGFHIRTEMSGWRGGIVPAHYDIGAKGEEPIPLASMLAAGLAINEAFLFTNGEMPAAGRRKVGLSLWNPSSKADWLEHDENEPKLTYLPSKLWLIGLGHLGQAYLWGLGLLPYTNPNKLLLVLQDIDEITPSTESTSILTHTNMIGEKKTRAMATWAERRGFTTIIHERIFSADFKRQDLEPTIALCGIDNALGRQALDQVSFDLIVEAGLGKGHQNFRSMRLHVLPGMRPASSIWTKEAQNHSNEDRAAYSKLLADGDLDQCGLTLLAGKAVGAPFVGAVAASLALSEILRLLHDGKVHQVIDLNLMSIEHRIASANVNSFKNFNPGYVLAGTYDPLSAYEDTHRDTQENNQLPRETREI